MFAGMQQAIELREGLGRFARRGRIDELPNALAPPAADDLLHLLGGHFAARRHEQGELGQILIEQAKHRPSQIEQVLRRRRAESGMPCCDLPQAEIHLPIGRFVDVLALAFFCGGRQSICRPD